MEQEAQENLVKRKRNPNFAHMFEEEDEVVDERIEEDSPKKSSESKNIKELKEHDSEEGEVRASDKSDENDEDIEKEEVPQKEEKKKYTDWKAQAEKESKRLKETQKWANETKSQLSAYKRAVESMINEGVLLKDDGEALLDHLQYKEIPDSALSEREKASKIFKEEIENIRKYGNYENLDGHVKALDHLVENSTQEEIDDLFGDIKDLVDEDSVLFTKKILEVAANYYDEVYSDISNAGSLKNLKLEYQNELSKRDKIIDKLEKEMVKLKKRYEDYDDNPQHRIPQAGGDRVGGSSGNRVSALDDPGGFLEDFRKRKYKN